MKNTWLFVLILPAVVLLSNSFSIQSEPLEPGKAPDPTSGLAIYGEYIYQRENCQRCHTHKAEDATARKISLDGLGGKYSDLWLYTYLLEPTLVNPSSKKVSYSHLFPKPLNPSIFQQLVAQQLPDMPAAEADALWPALLRQADALSENLKQDNVLVEDRTEILALLAYLQQIPPSPYQMKLDSIARAEELKKSAALFDALQNDKSIVFTTPATKTNIEMGRSIFQPNCSACHGMRGEGGIGPNLTDKSWRHGSTKRDIANTIVHGVPERGMISWKNMLSPEEVGLLVVFIRSIKGSNPPAAKKKQGKKG